MIHYTQHKIHQRQQLITTTRNISTHHLTPCAQKTQRYLTNLSELKKNIYFFYLSWIRALWDNLSQNFQKIKSLTHLVVFH